MGYCPICNMSLIPPECDACPKCGNTQWYVKTGQTRVHNFCPGCDGKGKISPGYEIARRGLRASRTRTCFVCSGTKKGCWTEFQVLDTRIGKLWWLSENTYKFGVLKEA